MDLCVEVLRAAKTIAADLQAADCLLESFFISLSDAHNFAYGAHLRAKLILYALELLKCPAGELDYNIIAVRNILVQRAVLCRRRISSKVSPAASIADTRAIGKPVALEARAEEREVLGLISMTMIRSVYRVMGELHVRSADYLDGVNDLDKPAPADASVHLLGMVSMGAEQKESPVCTPSGSIFSIKHTVIILFVRVTDNLQLQLFPAKDGLLYQYLADQAGLQTSGNNRLQLLDIVYQTAAGAAHGVCRTENDRIAQLVCDRQCFVYRIGNFTACHLDAQRLSIVFLNSIRSSPRSMASTCTPMTFTPYLSRTPAAAKLGAQIQAGLTAQVRKQGVRTFLCQ